MPSHAIKQVESELSDNSDTLYCINTDHLPRWRRAALWLCESKMGRALWMWPAFALLLAPVFYFGPWWAISIAVAGIFFSLGWNAAMRAVARGAPTSKL